MSNYNKTPKEYEDTSTPIEVSKLSTDTLIVQMGFFKGEILTIIDASFSDQRQCKAVKDIISKSFRDRINWFLELSGDERNRGQVLVDLDGTAKVRTAKEE